MKYLAWCALTALFFGTAFVQAERMQRASLKSVERTFDDRLQRLTGDPFELLGNTRGVYLDGYGAVFTSEVNLIVSPTINPFRLKLTKEETEAVHERKLKKLSVLKQDMQEILLSASASLSDMPPTQTIVVAVTLFNYNYEITTGLPGQIVMRGERQKLLDVHAGRSSKSALPGVISVEEI